MTTEQKIALELDDISVAYQDKLVLDQLSLTVEDNQILCLLGQSGSGKTTILKSIAGLVPLQAGQIKLHNRVLSSKSHQVKPENRAMSIIFQDFALFPHMTVLQNVAFGLKVKGNDGRIKAEQLLAMVKMADFGSAYPNQLSGGQQQRVAIARALATEPELLLLDEPFSNVDHHLKGQLMIDIRCILKQQGTAAIFVTHSKEEAFIFADQLAFMASGKITQIGAAETLYFQPKNPALAESMGMGNWLHVTVKDTLTTECPYLGLIEASIPHHQPVAVQMRQFIRPNELKINLNTAGDGKIIDYRFNGESSYYLIRLAELELWVSVGSQQQHLNTGDCVDITVLRHQAILFELI